ncbi:hypothetical protein ACE1TI_12640 [Alteribacillus sp. JSM 102045]|uniref:hypothetical protein n=1 Tax=Alteribacillus sp. JSM 102045 TaxID=1562101 RepID=UPI0035BFA009
MNIKNIPIIGVTVLVKETDANEVRNENTAIIISEWKNGIFSITARSNWINFSVSR